jgi:hypothetical protein
MDPERYPQPTTGDGEYNVENKNGCLEYERSGRVRGMPRGYARRLQEWRRSLSIILRNFSQDNAVAKFDRVGF